MQPSVLTDTARPRGRTHSFPSPPPSPLSCPSSFPYGGSLLSAQTGCIRADVDADTEARKKNILKIFFKLLFFNYYFGSSCRLEKRQKNFGFQSLRSPRSLSSPSSAGFVGEAARRRRFFRPSSPSHPSKLYSSLGWLNSKVPRPFSPFSLRLIDVDGF
jgi:hypothetical protein